VDRIAEEAATPPDVVNSENMTPLEQKAVRRHEAAKLVNGFVDRSVVKRTVMTSVYGVTYIGARKQIMEKIEEKLEAAGVDIEERADEIYAASGYLARLTMEVMGELFQGARQTMSWLAECARLISSHGQPMAWLSAIGVPVVQPYRQTKSHIIVTFLQAISL
jgi:DNA-directed RNA polymerase